MKPKKDLENGYSIIKVRGEYSLCYDLRRDNKRYNLKMKLKDKITFDENLKLFREKLCKKYPELE